MSVHTIYVWPDNSYCFSDTIVEQMKTRPGNYVQTWVWAEYREDAKIPTFKEAVDLEQIDKLYTN